MVQNGPNHDRFSTLTFAWQVPDDMMVKPIPDRIATWPSCRGDRLCWKREFPIQGAFPLHPLIAVPVSDWSAHGNCRKQWTAVLWKRYPHIHFARNRDSRNAASHAAKKAEHRSNGVPANHRNCARVRGFYGPSAKALPCLGAPRLCGIMLRILRSPLGPCSRVVGRSSGRYDGVAGDRFFGHGGGAVAQLTPPPYASIRTLMRLGPNIRNGFRVDGILANGGHGEADV